MKKTILVALSLLLLQACGNQKNEALSSGSTDQYTPPAAGSVVAQSSMPVIEDKLNHFEFSVKIVTNANSMAKGSYNVETAYGYNTANGELTMPAGGEHLKPVLKKGKEPYTYIIGFIYGDDSTFHDYFLVSGGHRQIEMKYIKIYSFK
jgi:hypothetical protein